MRLGLGMGLGVTRRRGDAISAIPNLADWWKSGAGLADTGGLIDSWTGSLNGRVLAATLTDRPTRDTGDTLDSPHWLAGATNQFLELAWPFAGFDHWLTVVAKSATGQSLGFESTIAAGAAQSWSWADTAGTQWFTNIPSGTNRLTLARNNEAARAVISFVVTTTYASVWRNGVKVGEASYSASPSVPATWRLGHLYNIAGGAYDFAGFLHDAILAGGTPAAGTVQDVHAQLMTLRGVS